MTRIEVRGLGKMGRPIVERLLEVGHDVLLRDDGHARGATSELIAIGATRAETASPDVLLLCLPHGKAVLEVLERHPHLPALVVDLTSSTRDEAIGAHRWVERRGGTYIDCPISGSSIQARDGLLTAFAGAPDGHPILEGLRRLRLFDAIIAAGSTGSGMALKLVNQAIHLSNLCALVEGERLVRAFGLDPAVALRGLAAASANSVMLSRFGRAVFEGEPSTQFKAALAIKDLRNVASSFAATGASYNGLPLLGIALEMLQTSLEGLGHDIDVSALGEQGRTNA
jgi:3-hydroxyisobutyrate dehydrogenase-like beta-hydroxyacid dehydrogenase